MKFVFLLGGLAGFLTGAGTAFFSGRSADRLFFDGAVGCLIGALLFRWFWNVLVRGVQETLVDRQTTPAPAKAK